MKNPQERSPSGERRRCPACGESECYRWASVQSVCKRHAGVAAIRGTSGSLCRPSPPRAALRLRPPIIAELHALPPVPVIVGSSEDGRRRARGDQLLTPSCLVSPTQSGGHWGASVLWRVRLLLGTRHIPRQLQATPTASHPRCRVQHPHSWEPSPVRSPWGLSSTRVHLHSRSPCSKPKPIAPRACKALRLVPSTFPALPFSPTVCAVEASDTPQDPTSPGNCHPHELVEENVDAPREMLLEHFGRTVGLPWEPRDRYQR
ncbi:hypothetical protein GWK47_025909 [Chionoecetes opilio]|uniref:Uncharacterized protein n=1 Tax=Chionoecetes opilio TaxID=41210 RepID=A0A8J8WEZ1_CHIOP|nr:hypothetical protein GWK47_025909 [Chionoecetes opilio]